MVELPESSGHDAIMTIVDSVSKRVHFVLMHTTVTAGKAARLFLHYVWKLHGLPKCVISNCRPLFVNEQQNDWYDLLPIAEFQHNNHVVTPYKHLGKISDNLHPDNQNNQLESRARPPRDVQLNA